MASIEYVVFGVASVGTYIVRPPREIAEVEVREKDVPFRTGRN